MMLTSKPATLLVGLVLIGTPSERGLADGMSPQQQADETSLMDPNGPLNPHGFPRLNECERIPLSDPASEAKANISRGDLRPFKIYGFINPKTQVAPGITCPSISFWPYAYRGGRFISDMPACGTTNTASNAPAEKMEAYNRILAADARFQQLTGCKPAPLKSDPAAR
ncbi:hypothetical protein [Sphingomonas morindae]|uniref:YARHG domain-containing protein n=1 Tax=Sphingomonas morindae TaxID=1541170 RepID=A0ABY4X9S2_9SPHN|nr:hypothetical protein [Sphingomonas morindae]USI73674.1 hypothetical protein LHA26_04155 [Sphingomonas morindae]